MVSSLPFGSPGGLAQADADAIRCGRDAERRTALWQVRECGRDGSGCRAAAGTTCVASDVRKYVERHSAGDRDRLFRLTAKEEGLVRSAVSINVPPDTNARHGIHVVGDLDRYEYLFQPCWYLGDPQTDPSRRPGTDGGLFVASLDDSDDLLWLLLGLGRDRQHR